MEDNYTLKEFKLLDKNAQEIYYNKVKKEKQDHYNLMVARCTKDCEINLQIWLDFYQYLKEIYLDNFSGLKGIISLGNFIREVLRCQEENPIKLDVEQCRKNLEYLEGIIEEKVEELKTIMSKVPVKAKKSPPKNKFKSDGSMSSLYIKWLEFLQACRLPEDTDREIEYIKGYIEPNPTSNSQVKEFLFSKGWKPLLFKDGANGKVPQLRDDNKNLCKSIHKLIKENPELEALDGLSVAQHRAGYLKAFLDTMDENGYVTAKFSAIAKTWRVKHIKPIVNLPSNGSDYGELVRKVLIAPEGKLFVNFDLDSLEDRTKRSCIIKLDPDYVAEMSDPSYDPHLAIGVEAGLLSQEESDFFKWYKNKNRKKEDLPESFKQYTDTELTEQFERLSKVRSGAKTTNYAATYSASPKKIAETAGIPLKLGKELHSAYWRKNKSVKQFTDSLIVKSVRGLDWIYSPYTNMFLYLSASHIKFSALNQNFGSKIHFSLLYMMMKKGYKPIMNVHDEVSLYINDNKEEKDKLSTDLAECIVKVNRSFNYGVEFGSTAEFAKSYGDVH